MYVPKFREYWLTDTAFSPWLIRDPEDESKPYCKVCASRLHCNTNHLNRHSRTVKHKAHLEQALKGGDLMELKHKMTLRKQAKTLEKRIPDNKPEILSVSSVLTSVVCKVDPGSNAMGTEEFISINETNDQKVFEEYQFIPADQSNEFQFRSESDNNQTYESSETATNQINNEVAVKSNDKSDTHSYRANLLDKIKRDRIELFDSYAAVVSQKSQKPETIEVKEKDHIDLYFESVSASVKRLTPKLIAEAKLRVSQLIGELELRHICASECTVQSTVETSFNTLTTNIIEPVTTSTSSAYYIGHPTVLRMGNEKEASLRNSET